MADVTHQGHANRITLAGRRTLRRESSKVIVSFNKCCWWETGRRRHGRLGKVMEVAVGQRLSCPQDVGCGG